MRFLRLSRVPSSGRAVTICPTCRLLLRRIPSATAARFTIRVSGSRDRSQCSWAIKLANTLSCGLIIVASVVQGGFCVATIVAVPGCGGYTLLNCGLTSTVPQSDRISYIHVDGSHPFSSLTLCCRQSARLTLQHFSFG